MSVKFLCRIGAVIAALIPLIACLPLLSFAAEDEVQKRIETLEKKTEELEKTMKEEHGPLLKEISEHVSRLEKELDTVDYRTARIKALQQRIETFSIGGDLSFFLQGIGANSQGLQEKADASYSGDLFLIAPVGPYGNIYLRDESVFCQYLCQ